jgi:hypothetical protein
VSWRHVFNAFVRAATAVVVVGVGGALGSAPGHALDAGASPDSAVTRAAAGGSAAPTPATKVEALDAADSSAIVRRWGIRIESLRLTASGYMLDFRYRVVDARKAKPLFERKTKPVLRDQASGVQMAVPVPPKTGALRSSNDPKAGRTYFMFFANPARFIAPGSLMTVTIGAFCVRDIRVDGESVADGGKR